MICGQRTETAVTRNEPVPLECDEQDRCEGAGLRSLGLPGCAGAEWHGGTLCLSGLRVSCHLDGGAGDARSLREDDFDPRSLFGEGQPHVARHSWRRRVHEARRGRAAPGDGFHPRLHRDYGQGDLRGARGSLPVVGTRSIRGHAGALPGGRFSSGRTADIKEAGRMANEGDGPLADNPGAVRHVPVMLAEVLAALEPAPRKRILDGTFGAGGYAAAILEQGAEVVALDRDPDAIAGGKVLQGRFGSRLTLVLSRFSKMLDHVEPQTLDGVVLDIGVSSMQIDEADRGFSFMRDGPLDMRMGQSGPSAADVVNRMKASDLTRIFGLLGEERHAGRIARAIEAERQETPFETTRQLVSVIEKVSPRRAQDKIHPATRVFQALRTYVNDELGELAQALFAAEKALKPGGRLVVVSFHSLEDRIVKRFFQERSGKASGSRHLPQVSTTAATFEALGKQPVSASEAESEINPRARSAKLRAGVRTDAPAGPADMSILPVPQPAAPAASGA
ncbi:MAG: S-adenosyl-methyltransferase [Rhizobiales bacterium]|nr:S-adenosyl-methyltransferase [Hyphomicrobiales bacterium]